MQTVPVRADGVERGMVVITPDQRDEVVRGVARLTDPPGAVVIQFADGTSPTYEPWQVLARVV
jgi:hypothetical protein